MGVFFVVYFGCDALSGRAGPMHTTALDSLGSLDYREGRGFSCSRGRIEHYIGHFAGHCSTTVGVSHAPRRWDTDADIDADRKGRK
jgi:hypothetical protein